MTAWVDRLEQLAAGSTPRPWKLLTNAYADHVDPPGIAAASGPGWVDWVCEEMGQPQSQDAALIVELRNALPAMLTALRAAHALDAELEHELRLPPSLGAAERLHVALLPLFGEDTTP